MIIFKTINPDMLTPTSKEKTEEVKLIVFVSSKPNTQTSQ